MPIKNNVLIVLIVLLLGATVIFGFLIYQGKNKKISNPTSIGNSIKKQVKTYPEDLRGEVYLTLRKKGDINAGIYYFDLVTKKLKEINIPQDCYVVGGGINAKGTKMVVSSDCSSETPGSSQIYFNNIDKELKVITKSPTDFKKEAVWSPDGKKVAFVVASPDERNNPELVFDTNNWNIFVSDLEGNEQFVGGGAHPAFSPDGKKILALREEGLFLFDLETKKGRRVHIFDTLISASIHLGLSDQKDQLAISDPHSGKIIIFKIKSWDNFELEEIQRIETKNSYASWPKFAPDNQKYLITQDVLDDNSIKLVAYNLETKEQYYILDLSEYEDTSMWINDWR